jgi:hypothetical protein
MMDAEIQKMLLDCLHALNEIPRRQVKILGIDTYQLADRLEKLIAHRDDQIAALHAEIKYKQWVIDGINKEREDLWEALEYAETTLRTAGYKHAANEIERMVGHE